MDTIETQYHEGRPHKKKRLHSHDEDNETQTMRKVEEKSTPNNNVPKTSTHYVTIMKKCKYNTNLSDVPVAL